MSILLAAVVVSLVQDADDVHRRVYRAAVDSVVAIRARTAAGERSGSGVVISADGLLLVSSSVVPENATNIRVWLKGPRRTDAEIVGVSRHNEIALLRIKAPAPLKPIVFGESSRLKAGDPAWTLGNASNSMINNDSPSLNAGIVSGLYALDEPRANSTYTGLVIETTAAVNVGMEGAPLLDAEGRMVGFVTLNYSPHRFLGNAIPMDVLKAAVEELRAAKAPEGPKATGDAPVDEGPAWFGAKVVESGGKMVVDTVEPGSPAEAAGLRKGIAILGAGARTFKTAADFGAFVKELKVGSMVLLSIEEDGFKDELKVQIEKKK